MLTVVQLTHGLGCRVLGLRAQGFRICSFLADSKVHMLRRANDIA